ncbi:MAG TPA: VOC family protein [Kofleriaceae bacterium]|nr:VOC family protein [Kofleriaceae bacterium]
MCLLTRESSSYVVRRWDADRAAQDFSDRARPARGARFGPAAARFGGIPLTAFEVSDLAAEHVRLKERGVVFTVEPTDAGAVRIAIFADTCGNLIQLYQPLSPA